MTLALTRAFRSPRLVLRMSQWSGSNRFLAERRETYAATTRLSCWVPLLVSSLLSFSNMLPSFFTGRRKVTCLNTLAEEGWRAGMVRLYCTPATFSTTTAALAFPFQIAQLQALPGAIDRLLATASRRVDSFCRKRVQLPGTTTVGTGGIAQGATSLPVVSTLGFDGGQEQAILLGVGSAQEIIPVHTGR